MYTVKMGLVRQLSRDGSFFLNKNSVSQLFYYRSSLRIPTCAYKNSVYSSCVGPCKPVRVARTFSSKNKLTTAKGITEAAVDVCILSLGREEHGAFLCFQMEYPSHL